MEDFIAAASFFFAVVIAIAVIAFCFKVHEDKKNAMLDMRTMTFEGTNGYFITAKTYEEICTKFDILRDKERKEMKHEMD